MKARENDHSLNKRALCLSILLNLILFGAVLLLFNPVFGTNDDYRMSLIASGAYSGTPSHELVYIKFPVNYLLQGLYMITDALPWYGIVMMMFIFVPCCVTLYYCVNRGAGRGIALYILFFLFIVQKHIMLPQYTPIAAFMGMGALLLFWFMPRERIAVPNLVGMTLMALCSAAIRLRVFIMLVPLFLLVFLMRVADEQKMYRAVILRNAAFLACPIAMCAFVILADAVGINGLTEPFEDFNSARSQIYDYGGMPDYDENSGFYESSGIDRSMYYALSARYLDFDKRVSAEYMEEVTEYRDSMQGNENFVARVLDAFSNTFSQFLDDKVLHQTVFAILLFVFTASLVMRGGRKNERILLYGSAAAAVAEMLYLCLIARVMDRVTECLLLALSLISLMVCLGSRSTYVSGKGASGITRFLNVISSVCVVTAIVCMAASNQVYLAGRSRAQNDLNERLSALNEYAAHHRECFYFYDAYDFIAASSDVFACYDDVVNTDSLGNWNVRSETYYERNESYGFDTSIDGLLNPDHNTYYVAIGALKNGAKYLVKDKYNAELKLMDSFTYNLNSIFIYEIVPY